MTLIDFTHADQSTVIAAVTFGLVAAILSLDLFLPHRRPAPVTPPHFDTLPAPDSVTRRMADVMAERFRVAGECTSRDLAEAGFSVAEITALQYEAARLASLSLRPAPDTVYHAEA